MKNFLLEKKSLDQVHQVPVIESPIDENHTIIGPHGTGKTTIAIHRANFIYQKLLEEKKKPKICLFMFNHTLKDSVKFKLKGFSSTRIEVITMFKWLSNVFYKHFGSKTPQIAKYKPDWVRVKEMMRDLPVLYDHIIIDEAQLIPIEMILCLKIVSKNITIFFNNKDATQSVLNIRELQEAEIDNHQFHFLEQNFRNSPSISKLVGMIEAISNEIKPGKILRNIDDFDFQRLKSSLPSLQTSLTHNENGGNGLIRLNKFSKFHNMLEYMIDIATERNESHIGVFLPKVELVKKYYEGLKLLSSNLSIQSYYYEVSRNRGLKFEEPGIKLMTYNSSYGHEFETIIIPSLGDSYYEDLSESKMAYFMLASARASKEIFMAYQEEDESDMIQLLSNLDFCIN